MLPALSVLLLLACQVRNSSPRIDSAGAGSAEDRPAVSSEADTAAARAQAWVATGTEPFWALDIDSTGLRFKTPDDTMGIRWPPLKPLMAGDTLRWLAEAGRAMVDARIWPGKCSDGMSDRIWPNTAVVRIDSTSYRGCAESR